MSMVLLVAFALSMPATAGSDPVVQRLKRFLTETRTPGVSIALMAENSRKPKVYGAGLADVALNVRLKNEMALPVGSITKLFTSISIYILADEGKLSLDDRISKWFPDYPRSGEISVDQLINHTSGLKDFVMIPAFNTNMAKAYTEDELLNMTAAFPLDFPPGTAYRYSNTGYVMLGLIVEKISKMSFEQFIQQRIIKPLGMTDTRTGSDSEVIMNRVTGYRVDPDKLCNAVFSSVEAPHASGNMISSPKSFVLFDKVFRNGSLLKSSTYQMINQPPTVEEALAKSQAMELGGIKIKRLSKWGIEWVKVGDGAWLATKDGVFPGYSSMFIYSQQKGVCIALSCNNENAVFDLLMMGNELISAARGK